MQVIKLLFVLCVICMQNAYSMDIATIDKMRQDERYKLENREERKNYSREGALEVLNRYAVGQASFSDAVEVLEQMAKEREGLCIIELPWWKTRESDVRKLLLLYYYEHMGFRMVGTRPAFEVYIKERKDAAPCREEFEEIARYLQYDVPSVCFDEEKPAMAIRHTTQNDIQEIYDSICRVVSEFEVESTEVEEGEYERASENRMIGAMHVIYLWGNDSSKDAKKTIEAVIGALAALLRANKLDAELLETGWVRANISNVRVAYLLAYYLLYGDKADTQYQQLGEYVNHFENSEERMEEIQQVHAFIESPNAQHHRVTGESFSQ